MLKRITLFFILLTWPLSLFLANTFPDFIHYIIPSIVVFITFLLSTRNHKYYFLPLFLIPLIEPKFAILPFFFLLLNFKKEKLIYIFLSILLMLIFIKPFKGQTIFTQDYQAQQKILQQEKLYNSVPLARLFQNKPRIVLTKFTDNLFVLTDPNNYFFGFAPGQIKVDNQNLQKFPFLALPFLLIGLFTPSKKYKFLITLSIALLLNLSLLTNFDRNDFILFVPLILFIINGLEVFHQRFKYANLYDLALIIFAFTETIRIFLTR